MTLIEGMRFFLLGNTNIATLVGTRVYPLRLPQKAVMPAIVLTRVSEMNAAHLRGPDVLTKARIQVDAWAQTFDAAVALGTLCAQRLDGYQGTWTDGGSPASVIKVMAIFHDVASDHFEEEILGGLCRQSTDFFVHSAPVGEGVLI